MLGDLNFLHADPNALTVGLLASSAIHDGIIEACMSVRVFVA